jgi:ribonuclease G
MKKEIYINSALNEVRVAITEDGQLAEFFIELPNKERYIGNIYYGRVNKVVPGINAAFIDIGLNQDAFLHFSDVDESLENIVTDEDDDEEEAEIAEVETADKQTEQNKQLKKGAPNNGNRDKGGKNGNFTFQTKRSGTVLINLEEGQEVIVQVTREAYHNKGVKVTTKIALPGRYLVLLPSDELLGVSKKISIYQERRRLRGIARQITQKKYGCIIRTAAKGKNEDDLRNDWEDLLESWREIEGRIHASEKPGLVYQDLQLAKSIVRDLFTNQVQRIVIDSKKLFKEIQTYIRRVSPQMEGKIELYSGEKNIFEQFGVERELLKTYKRKVSMKGGGDIVIDQTEAMTVIDVNSGRSSESNQEQNALGTNLEAAREVARQVRLRDLGGIIIVDFIDMQQENNRKKLFNEMKKEVMRDRAKTVIYPLSQLGLLQMTRQRINQNIVEKITDTCPMCRGTGRITSKAVLMNDIERWLRSFRKKSREFRLVLHLHPSVAEYITEGAISILAKLMIKYFVKIKIKQTESVKVDEFKFYSIKQQKDITNDYQ